MPCPFIHTTQKNSSLSVKQDAVKQFTVKDFSDFCCEERKMKLVSQSE